MKHIDRMFVSFFIWAVDMKKYLSDNYAASLMLQIVITLVGNVLLSALFPSFPSAVSSTPLTNKEILINVLIVVLFLYVCELVSWLYFKLASKKISTMWVQLTDQESAEFDIRVQEWENKQKILSELK